LSSTRLNQTVFSSLQYRLFDHADGKEWVGRRWPYVAAPLDLLATPRQNLMRSAVVDPNQIFV
jgi:hypothetical protein